MDKNWTRRVVQVAVFIVVSVIAHFSLQAPATGLPCVAVERSNPYVFVMVCPPV